MNDNQKFFVKMVIKSMLHKKSRLFSMFLSSTVATLSFFFLFSIYFELPKKFSEAFRSYGANVVFFPQNNKNFKNSDLDNITKYFSKDKLVSTAFYSYINTEINLQPIVVAATNINDAYKTNPFWDIQGSLPKKDNEVIIGKEVSNLFSLDIGDVFGIKFKINKDKAVLKKFKVAGILQTGKSEESFVFANYYYVSSFFEQGLDINIIEASIAQEEKELLQKLDDFNKDHKNISAVPVKNITTGEYKVFSKLKSLIFVVNMLIFSIIGISLFTIVVSIIREKREEIAIKRSIGGEYRTIFLEFIVISLFVSFLSTIIGIILGYFCAKEASFYIFLSPVDFRFSLAILSLVVNTILIFASFFLPVKKIMNIEIAKTLKGE